MRNTPLTKLLAILAAAAFVASSPMVGLAAPSAAASAANAANSFPTNSWALGVVVPNGSGLQNGDKLSWERVANLTATVTLPNMTLPDGVVYAVMSVMAKDGAVLQTAAGVFPNRSIWLAYAWAIPGSTPPSYRWILNGSEPAMKAGANISMSIYSSLGGWELRIADRDTGASVSRPFPGGIASSLKAGDQEVFALESYSRSGATFQRMGNLTLKSVMVNGEKVTSGFYSYGDWDPNHNPVFVVGSSGTTPPSFVYLDRVGSGSFVWGFAGFWGGASIDYGGLVTVSLIVLVVGIAVVALLVAYRVVGKSSRSRLSS